MAEWTASQQDAIRARNGTVLVSAAAGSGKTSVLVERVIQRITDEENPASADRLLVVTFTKAAAAEMRGRIEKAIAQKIRENPEDSRLRRQQVLLAQANISTVDSFCAKISREFFENLNISPDFKIVADKQQEDLQAEAMNTAIGELFENGAFALADAFSSERDDRRLMDAVKTLYDFTRSHLYPDSWLDEKLGEYDSSIGVWDTVWGRSLKAYGADVLDFCGNIVGECLKAVREDEKLFEALSPVFSEDAAVIGRLSDLIKKGSWDDFSQAVASAAFLRFPTPKGYKDDPLKLRLQSSRETVTNAVKKDLAVLFSDSEDRVKKDIETMRPAAKALSELVKRFSRLYDEAKAEKNLADYSDIEHYAVKLFLENRDGEIRPTALAEEVAGRFDEIMIDEYQDTNEVQDWIFKAISQNGSNRFMVGDVKQSIYSFRQAMPDIFIAYKKAFESYDRSRDRYPCTISLDKNFRSRPEVIHSVNYVFSQLMSSGVGGVDYSGGEMLAQGLECPEKPGCETVVDFIEKSEETPMEAAEARHIAATIKEMLDNGYTVTGKDGERPASYRDFCVLLRSANKYAFNYADEMARAGVPSWAAVTGGFFTSPEILSVLSFLQVIDNPNQDIPLLSVLTSPVYGYTADDLAAIRLEDRSRPVYVSMLQRGGGRFQKILEDLEHYRMLAATMPSGEFLSYFYMRTGYIDIAAAMENGESRIANLRRLRQYAEDYEKAGYAGISGFIRFIDKLRASKSDMESANLISENADVVRIMSIHKSKGLEFPVCIIAGCGRKLNSDRDEVSLNARLGLGIKLIDENTGARYSNIIRDAVRLENRRQAASEELRVFYVAMTRAREKLIMVSTVNNIDKALGKLAPQIDEGKAVPPFVVSGASSIAEWLMLCALRHPSAGSLRHRVNAGDTIIEKGCFTPWKVRVLKPVEAMPRQAEAPVAQAPVNRALMEGITARCNYQYPFEEVNRIPAKVTASAVAGDLRESTLNRPAFLSFKGLTPAERGIALHSYMQFADFSAALKNPERELERLVSEGFITAEQGAAVNLIRVKKFLQSSLGRRIAASDNVKKEQRFSVNIPASMIAPDLDGEYRDTPVILQGAVDCSFTENGRLYILDFKTDRVESAEELAAEYGMQLKLYAKALEQVTGMEVGGCCLYSLHLDMQCDIPL